MSSPAQLREKSRISIEKEIKRLGLDTPQGQLNDAKEIIKSYFSQKRYLK